MITLGPASSVDWRHAGVGEFGEIPAECSFVCTLVQKGAI